MHRSRRRYILPSVILGGVLLLASLVLGGAGGTGASPQIKPTPMPPNFSTPVGTRITEPIRGSGRTVKTSGPETRGTAIQVRGKQIRLPADAWVEDYYATMLCEAGHRCPETPLLVLRRGNSTIAVSAPSGVIYEHVTVPGEEDTFRFLLEALR